MKNLLLWSPLFILFVTFATDLSAQDCYNYTRNQAITYYNKGEFQIAKDQFEAARICPDKPSDDDLESWIGKCNDSLEELARNERLERERRVKEQKAKEEQMRQEEERKRKIADQGYMRIYAMDFANVTKEYEIIDNYGADLKSKELRFLAPRIMYKGLEDKSISIDVKIIKPDGSVMKGNEGSYTYSTQINVKKSDGYNYATLSGWGNSDGGSYSPGDYKIQLWYNGKFLYSQKITVHSDTVAGATYITVNGKEKITALCNAEGGSRSFTVETDGKNYLVRLLPEWCSLEAKSAGSFTIQYDANRSGKKRADYLEIKSGDKSATISIEQPAENSIDGPSAIMANLKLEHDKEDGGIWISMDLLLNNVKGESCKCNYYFYNSDKTPLKDKNKSYYTTDGNVAATKIVNPDSDSRLYENYKLFLPYSELHLTSGEHRLYFEIQVMYGNKLLDYSKPYYFTVRQ